MLSWSKSFINCSCIVVSREWIVSQLSRYWRINLGSLNNIELRLLSSSWETVIWNWNKKDMESDLITFTQKQFNYRTAIHLEDMTDITDSGIKTYVIKIQFD